MESGTSSFGSLLYRVVFLFLTAVVLYQIQRFLFNTRVPQVTAGARGMGTGLASFMWGPIPGFITGLLLYYFDASERSRILSFVIPPFLQLPFILFRKPTEDEDIVRGVGMLFGFCSLVVYVLSHPGFLSG
eukprot:TRINITY_DN15361_c0_g1_i1.p1 TRINITY_DN15361_c0_g1~~TRINITY_DN15361_c0_g1_i1.p1  ORF type:complete len:131 (-),score=23.29 TRINITY_DN15361_c0_g1_i1:341-733(-)